MKRGKIGLALSSGAFRGFAHIGVLKKLEEHNLQPDYITGSSIGAWMGAHYALYQDLNKLIREIKEHQAEKFLSVFSLGLNKGLISSKKTEKFLQQHFNDQNLKDCKIPINITSTNLQTGKPYIFTQEKIHKAVRASISVPLVFTPFEYNNMTLVDGGLYSPVPINLAREMGADKVIAVNLYTSNELKKKKTSLSLITIRTVRTIVYHFAKEESKSADLILNPDTSFFLNKRGNKKYFSDKDIDQMIEIGEKETEKNIDQIKKLFDKE